MFRYICASKPWKSSNKTNYNLKLHLNFLFLMPKWIIFSIMQIFMDVIQKEWVLGFFLWNVYMDYLPHKRALNGCESRRRERVQNVKRFKGREKTRRLKKASQLMKAKQRVFWGSQVLQVKAVPCSQHMQLIIQLDTGLGSMVRSNLFMRINCSAEYSSLPLASACLPSVSIQGFLVHLFLSFFLSFFFFFFLFFSFRTS